VWCRQGPCEGLTTCPHVLPTIYKINNFEIYSEWEQDREINPSMGEEEEEEDF
jgi:hypothetical protein